MRVRCIHNRGIDLRPYEYKPITNNEIFGRFGSSGMTEFNEVKIGREYLVMGILLGEGALYYLIDDGADIDICPYPLFEVIDHTLPSSWFFKASKHTDSLYPYQEAVWGYYEFVFDDSHYEKLVDMEEGAMQIYFKRKRELEKALTEPN